MCLWGMALRVMGVYFDRGEIEEAGGAKKKLALWLYLVYLS